MSNHHHSSPLDFERREFIAKKIINELIPACSNGNKPAEDYLNRIFYVIRTLDDFYDGDIEVKKEELLKAFFILAVDLQQNDFFRLHRDALTAIHVTGYNAWLDSNALNESPDLSSRHYAQVIRDQICEILPFVAYLTGGWNSMRDVSARVRKIFMEEIVPANKIAGRD